MTKVKALAWTHIVLNGALLAFGIVLCAQVALSSDKNSTAPGIILPMVFWLSALFWIPGLVGGIGLLALQNWARVLIVILSLLLLLLIPIGTALGVAGLWILLGREAQQLFGAAQQKTAQNAVSAAVAAEVKGASGVLLAAAGVGSGMIVMLGAGFMISGDPAPPEIITLFYPAVVVFVAVVALSVRLIARDPPRISGVYVSMIKDFFTPKQDWEGELRARLEQLRADPARAKYAALIEAGETWYDKHIDYDIDPAARATCEHLKAIEGAMREAGVTVRYQQASAVDARCRIDEAALKARFSPAESVGYAAVEYDDRGSPDPYAVVWCSACSSQIFVVHPNRADSATPVFPA